MVGGGENLEKRKDKKLNTFECKQCPVCGSKNFSEKKKLKIYRWKRGRPWNIIFTVLICQDCSYAMFFYTEGEFE